MKSSWKIISDDDLAQVHGGKVIFQSQGMWGGSLKSKGGSSIESNPFFTKITLTNEAANFLSKGLSVAATAVALPVPQLAVAAGATSSMINLMNNGNGVEVTVPHPMPGAIITPR